MGPKKDCTGPRLVDGVARARVLILPLLENSQQLLVDVAAGVEALVDDQRLLVTVGVEVALKLAQRRLVHRADVQVADFAAGELFHQLAALFNPLFVQQRGVRASTDRLDLGFPGAFG
jgi:hypothetical protein